MGVRRLPPALLLGAVLLAGCGSSSPADELRSKVAAVTDAANNRDANALRSAVDDLLATAKLQHDTGKLDLGRYREIQGYATRVKADAALLDPPAARTAPPATTAPPTTTPVTTPPQTSQPLPTDKGDGKGKGGKGKHDASPAPSLNPVLPTTGPTVTASP